MSTVTPTNIDEGAAYSAASVNGAFTGVSTGLNAVDDDDFADNAFGVEHPHAAVVDYLTAKTATFPIGTASTAVATAYPGYGVTTGWTSLVIGGTNVQLTAATPFEVGPASPEKVTGVLVGAMFAATGDGHLAIGVKHSGSGGSVVPIAATDYRPNGLDYYSVEIMIDETHVPPGNDLEEIWLLASGPTLTVGGHGQLWALPLHGE